MDARALTLEISVLSHRSTALSGDFSGDTATRELTLETSALFRCLYGSLSGLECSLSSLQRPHGRFTVNVLFFSWIVRRARSSMDASLRTPPEQTSLSLNFCCSWALHLLSWLDKAQIASSFLNASLAAFPPTTWQVPVSTRSPRLKCTPFSGYAWVFKGQSERLSARRNTVTSYS